MDEKKEKTNTNTKKTPKKASQSKKTNTNKTKNVKKDITKETHEEKSSSKKKTLTNVDKKNCITLKTNIAVISSVLLIVFGMLVGTTLMLLNYNFNFLNLNDKKISTSDKNLKEFVEVYNELSNDYYKDIDKEKAIKAAIAGMMSSVEDANTSYLSEEETKNLEEKLQGNYEGIGAELLQDGNTLRITNIFTGSPAYNKLQVDDIIKKVDGKEIVGKDVSTVADMIKGVKGTTVSVTVERNGKEKTYKLIRGNVNIDSVTLKVMEKNNKKVGLITIELFGERTSKEFEDKLKELDEKKIKDLIIDVRFNTGGYLQKSAEIISLFLNKKQVMYQLKDKKGSEKVYSLKNSKRDMNVIVLINEYSASASEILAAALKESYGAKLVGMKSYGKGTVQTTKGLSNGSMVKLTTQEWLTPKGNEINKKGLEPDIKVEQSKTYYENPTDENDDQLQKALEELTK